MIRKYRYLLTAAAAVGAAGLLTFAARNDFGLGRNMEIAVNMMRELSLNYVDPVDPDRLMEGAAAGMVSDLDPYTEYIPEEGMQDSNCSPRASTTASGRSSARRTTTSASRSPTRDRPPTRPG